MSSPLIERLQREFSYPTVDASSLNDFLKQNACTVLFFTEEPSRFPESNDVAVVLPELVKAFQGKFTPAIVARSDEKKLQSLYGFQSWPALVFLRGQNYLGAITGIQDWGVYLDEINTILASTGSRPPAIGIPVVSH
ncbi:MAG: hydrogenase-1 expression HyaE [Thiolinea sp.]|nr:hydrogenase-1 expression HyaE [Thiolinea sp.]